MLSQQTIAIIKSTVQVLEVHGTEITTTFYQSLFNAHPELLNLFNHANQKQGKQQAALANAVYAAALHIDRLEAILPVVKQIAHKHRSLGILPEHYPIVGQHLLGAIKTVLGDAATDDMIGAWGEAYGVIADAFIGIESEMSVQAAEQVGGWSDYRAFRVERKVQESDVITSFYLVPQDGQPLAAFEPGQYVSVKMTIPGETYTHIRQYSLSDAPGKPYYRISVKREAALEGRPAGKVSVHLHKDIQEGSTLLLSAPAGDFILDPEDTKPIVLISGGVGLTPMISMLNTLAETEPNRQVTFIHAAHNEQSHAMREHVEKLVHDHSQLSAYWCYAQPAGHPSTYHKQGYLDLPWLTSIVPSKEASFYFCGPTPFMRVVNGMLKAWGVLESDIHFEFFGPADTL
ncbi:nitric oxide dioxygenase [Paenibacillus sp. 1_12]|uniref:NO-inducible flavohemoprotein n=1 Tax=Paenibacillus sp. 1_12 TaxID=1566278 RepID=UPI0008EDFA57|nr:NO-inducible flavohemoprotein [Paenibacillus sp. 1_12]SFL65042.1 nitric oxide dioxygenase [Paenibacillus sp. 1_12]